MIISTTVEYKDLEFEVVGDFTPSVSGSYETESFPANIDIHSILFNGTDVLPLIDIIRVNDFERIIKIAIDNIIDRRNGRD